MTTPMKAKSFALEKHGDQKYGEMPYEFHLFQVVSKFWYLNDANSDLWSLKQIGWLHDVIEDTAETEGSLFSAGFDRKVVDAVMAVTKLNESYSSYIQRVKSNHLALKVKIADTLCNLENSLISKNNRRIIKYTKQLALLTEL